MMLRDTQQPPRSRMRQSLALILILLFGFALRVVDLDRMPPFAHGDDATLAEYSQVVLRGETPWQGVRSDGDTNWAFLQYAVFRAFGDDLWALRITSVFWSMLALSGAYYGVRQMFDRRVALYAIFLMAAGHLLIHFGRVATIVLPALLTSFLAVGLYLRAQPWQARPAASALRPVSALLAPGLCGAPSACPGQLLAEGQSSPRAVDRMPSAGFADGEGFQRPLTGQLTAGVGRPALLALAGALLAFNLYQYAAAKPVFFAIAALWLLSLPRRREAWPPFLKSTAWLAAGFLLVAAPIAWWYVLRPIDLYGRAEFLSVFSPRYAAANLRLYGTLEPLALLYGQTLRSLGAFAVIWDTSPNYHFDAALLDPVTLVLSVPGLVLAFRRSAKLALVLLIWLAAGLIAGAILLADPPTSYHYIVLVPIAMVFAALCLDRLSATPFGRRFVPLVLACVAVANIYLYFGVYPTKGAWYSLESDLGFFVRGQQDCCSVWYMGEPETTPRKISALIAGLTPIHYMRDEDQLVAAITPYLADEQPDLIIVPQDKVDRYLPRLRRRYPQGRAHFYMDRGHSMFCVYTLGRKAQASGRYGRND